MHDAMFPAHGQDGPQATARPEVGEGIGGPVSIGWRECTLTRAMEIETLRDWIENHLEDDRELTGEFAAKIERSRQEMNAGLGRVRNPAAP